MLRVIGLGIWTLISLFAAPAEAQSPPSAGLLYAAPDIDSPALSPSGERLAFIRHNPGYRGGQVIIVDMTDASLPVLHSTRFERELKWVRWANEDRILTATEAISEITNGYFIYEDEYGRQVRTNRQVLDVISSTRPDGSDGVFLFDPANRRLGAHQTQLDYVVDFLPDDPDHVLMGLRNRGRNALHVHRVNVETGRDRRVDTGRVESLAWFTNSEGVTVMRLDAFRAYREVAVLVRQEDGSRWTRVAEQPINNFSELQDGVHWVARTQTPSEALVLTLDPQTRTTGLMEYDFFSATVGQSVFVNEDYDVSNVFVDPVSGRALGLTWADERTHLVSFDPQIAEHLPTILERVGESTNAVPLQRAGDHLLLMLTGPSMPPRFAAYAFSTGAMLNIGPQRLALSASAFADVRIHRYTARDGTELFGYVTTPPYPIDTPTPLVVLPHGGPVARDYYGFDELAQLIAANGYMVFQPQFRGSAGFGRDFVEAGHGEWGGLMQTDITDGVRDLITDKSIDQSRICVAGWSYGGYAALMQAALEPELYRCSAAGAPVTDLAALLAWEEERADAEFPELRTMIGADNPDRMAVQSPVNRAAEITIPVLLVHGTYDRIVPIEQSEAMLQALEASGQEVRLFEFDGGHALNNRRDMQRAVFQITRFLDQHLAPQ